MSEWILWLVTHQWAMFMAAWCLASGVWMMLHWYGPHEHLGMVFGIGMFLFSTILGPLEWHLCAMGIIGLVGIRIAVDAASPQAQSTKQAKE